MAGASIVVVGVGSIGRRHIRNLIALGVDPTDISAVDIRLNQFNTTDIAGIGVQTVWCGREISEDDLGNPTAMLICTPAHLHAQFIAYAQRRQIPFFVEKPVTLSTAEPIDWSSAVPHLVACNMRFRPELQALKAIAAGACTGRFECTQDMSTWPGVSYADPIFEFCHEIDLALWMFGPIDAVTTVTRTARVYEIALEHSNHKTSTVRIGDAPGAPTRRWGLVHYERSFVQAFEHERDVNWMYLDEMAHFLRVARGDEPSVNTLRDARRVLEVCEFAIGACA